VAASAMNLIASLLAIVVLKRLRARMRIASPAPITAAPIA